MDSNKEPSLFGLIQNEQQRCVEITEDAIRIIQQLSYHLLGDEGDEAKEGGTKEIRYGSAHQLLSDVQNHAYRLAKLRDLIAGVSEIF